MIRHLTRLRSRWNLDASFGEASLFKE